MEYKQNWKKEYKEFKDRLRELRTQRGLSQRDLGEKLGIGISEYIESLL